MREIWEARVMKHLAPQIPREEYPTSSHLTPVGKIPEIKEILSTKLAG